MPNYILLMTLTREGQEAVLRDADFIVEAASETHVQDVQGLGLYGVLGPYDFVSIIEAPDNDAAARYSIRLGVRAGATSPRSQPVAWRIIWRVGCVGAGRYGVCIDWHRHRRLHSDPGGGLWPRRAQAHPRRSPDRWPCPAQRDS